MTKIYGKGLEILAFFNIEYESYIQEFANELMSHPNKRYRLSLEPAPLLRRKKKEMKKEIRYHFNGHFVEEQRRGFPVHHQMQKDVETFAELQDIYDGFLSPYNKLYCKGLAIGISEEPTLVE